MTLPIAKLKSKKSARIACPASKPRRLAKKSEPEISLPPAHDWRPTDEDEINRRRLRAREGSLVIRKSDARFPVFSNFSVGSGSGLTYAVEIRDVTGRQFACACQDFRKNGLGTCKHVEAALLQLEARFKRLFAKAVKGGSPRVDVVPDDVANTLRVERGLERLPAAVRKWFADDGRLSGTPPEDALATLEKLRAADLPELRLSQEIGPWLEVRRHRAERKELVANTS